MTKRLIASEEVANWINAYVDKTDCDLWYMIEDLKQALLDTTMIQVDLDADEYDDQIKTLQKVNAAIVHALRNLKDLYEEVEDQIIPTNQKKGGEQ